MGNVCARFSLRAKKNANTLPGKDILNSPDEIISYIEKRLANVIAADKADERTSGLDFATSYQVTCSVIYGSNLLENVLKRCESHSFKIVSNETTKIVIDVLKEASQIHFAAAGLSLVAYVLHIVEDVSIDKKESIQLLQNMYDLAKHIKQSNGHVPQQKLNDAGDFLVKGSFFCISRIKSSNLSRFFFSKVGVAEINILQSELAEKYRDLKWHDITETLERRPAASPPLQEDSDEELGNACAGRLSTTSVVDKQDDFVFPEVVLSGLDELMSYIEKYLAKLSANNKEEDNTSGVDVAISGGVTSSIKYGSHLLENVLKFCQKHSLKVMIGETRTVVIDILKKASQIQWIAAELSVVVFVLKNIDNASINKQECVSLLQSMYILVKQMKQANEPIPQEKLQDVAEFIFKGSFFCISRIQSANLSRFFSSVVDIQEIKRLQSELSQKYQDLMLEPVTKLFNLMPIVLPPSQEEHPDAVGFDDAVSKITDLLAIDEDLSTTAVVVFGKGGMGKTTLANAVFGSLELKGYRYSNIILKQDCSETDLKDLQEQILKDLFGKRLKLRNYKRGQEEISKVFRKAASQPLFLFIDNVMRGSDLAKLLPENLSCIPKRSRMLVTASMLDKTNILDQRNIITRLEYNINFLPLREAKQLLCQKVFDNPDGSYNKNLDIDGLVKLCGGIPLVLNLDSLAKGEGELTERAVDMVYNSLQKDRYKDAFIDIAAFFSNWDRHTVSYIVGENELVALEEAALVKISKGQVELHDVVLTRGRKLSESNRITDPQSLADIIEDKQRLKELKGIWLRWKFPDEPAFQLLAEHLDKMHNSLRVLCLTSGTKVNGMCTRNFENLRYLVNYGDCSPVELNKLPRLAIFEGCIESDVGLCNLPHSLRNLKVNDLESIGLAEGFGNLPHLEELELSQNKHFMTTLPDSFCQITSLRRLKLSSFKELTSLPSSFGNLYLLEKVEITNCLKLKYLPESFGLLKFLKELELTKCKMLRNLPNTFSQLTNLKKLLIEDCTMLSNLSEKFGQLNSLEYLRIRACNSLQRLSHDFRSLTCVAAIDASRCPVLEANALEQMIELKSLIMLKIAGSPILIDHWENIKVQHPLLVRTYTVLMEWGMYKHSLWRALFDEHSRFLNVDGGVREWSSIFLAGEEKIAFLVTCCDLCSLANEKACQMVKKRREYLSTEGFHIMYVGLMEQSEKHACETLVRLSHGIRGASLCAWIAPRPQWKHLFGFSACVMVSPWEDYNRFISEGWELVSGVHTFIASAHMSTTEKGEPQVQDLTLMFPKEEDEEGGMTDFGGGFTSLYLRFTNIYALL
ncbi:hypothetical protein SUGI_0725900 [Cryptomeria japonica]|nr:hypothetical protein SUGI_0725900 [Cryptomeria japonica]